MTLDIFEGVRVCVPKYFLLHYSAYLSFRISQLRWSDRSKRYAFMYGFPRCFPRRLSRVRFKGERSRPKLYEAFKIRRLFGKHIEWTGFCDCDFKHRWPLTYIFSLADRNSRYNSSYCRRCDDACCECKISVDFQLIIIKFDHFQIQMIGPLHWSESNKNEGPNNQ